ncbi:hypothetical protein LTR78_000549 [Recurvomyces mirabilis]|uniref:Ankyrin repeat protein n=1 Tax=Recurvomyces mirabilis TaxID=574656 RepID=A0AAE0WXH0_9PEZI|nr:hypothetical protein LTR78_000549 [Recurvomyces mirabilis]KAK5162203.1 Transient receptor putative cation channel subfamily A member 1 [Recurvomyces mirabilis]
MSRRVSPRRFITNLSADTEGSTATTSDRPSPPGLESGSHSTPIDLELLRSHSAACSKCTPDVQIVDDPEQLTSSYMDDGKQMSSNLACPGPLWPSRIKSAYRMPSDASQAEPELWDERMGFGAARAAGSSAMFQVDLLQSANFQREIMATSEDMLFDMEIEDSTDEYLTRLNANQERWDAMQGRQARDDMLSGSAIRSSIKQYLQSSEFGQRITSVEWGSLCPICGHHAGSTKRALLCHAQVHVEHVPEPKFKCSSCDIAFVFKADRQLHCQPRLDYSSVSASSPQSDCESLLPQAANCWILEATRQDYISELRCWETLQIKAYFDSVRVMLCRQFEGLRLETLRLSEAQFKLVASYLPGGIRPANLSCMPRIDTDLASDLEALAKSFARTSLEHNSSPMQTGQTVLLVGTSKTTQCVVSFSPLMRALASKNAKEFASLLDNRHRHTCSNCEWYSLCWACGAGNLEAVIRLLDSAILVDDFQQVAIAYGELSIAFGSGGPLEIAMRYGRHDVVDELFRRGLTIASKYDIHADYFITLAHQTRSNHWNDGQPSTLAGSTKSHPINAASISQHGISALSKQDKHSRLEQMIRAGLNVNTNHHSETLLNHCVRHRLSSVVKCLMDHGADLIAADDAHGDTPLLQAVKTCDNALLRVLLVQRDRIRACINAVNKDGVTALLLACRSDNKQAVQALLEVGADPSTCDPLLAACDGRHVSVHNYASMVNELVAAGARVNVRDPSGMTPLMLAIHYKSIPAVRCLVAAGADVLLQDELGRNALVVTKQELDTTMAQIIQACLAEAFKVDYWSHTGLHHICAMEPERARETVNFLLDHGANLDSRDSNRDSLLHYTFKDKYAKSTREAIRSPLLEARVSVNASNARGSTPLMLAVHSSVIEAAALLRSGALLDLQDEDGNTTLHLVCRREVTHQTALSEKIAMVELLIHKGARLDLRNAHGRTALMEASCTASGAGVTSLLLGAGVDASIQDNKGATALMLAVAGRKAESVRAFLRAGVE